jgi:hypothetical protein
MLAEQVGDAIARGRGADAGGELPAQLNPDRARQYSRYQQDHAARAVIPDIGRGIGGRLRMIEHRHAEQLGRGDEAGKGREPEIEPQGRENDEDEIGQRHHEAERLHRAHVLDVHGKRNRRQRGLDQRADVTPDHRRIMVMLQAPGDGSVHPQFEQDERNEDPVEVIRPEAAPPDMVQRMGVDHIDGPQHDKENCSRRDQRLDTNEFGLHHLPVQRVLELGRDCRRPPARLTAQYSQHRFFLVIPGWSEGPDPESRDSGFAGFARAPE